MKGKSDFQHWKRTFVLNLTAIQYAIFVLGDHSETSYGSSRKQWTPDGARDLDYVR